jgi:hypothetical protein
MTNPRSIHYVPVDERRELVEQEVTLNGKRAKVTGLQNDFATVCFLTACSEFLTVRHVINNSGSSSPGGLSGM